MSAYVEAKYFGSDAPVRLGDHVRARIFIRKFPGRVVYVPGISPANPQMESEGLTWIGIRFENGTISSEVVDPANGWLRKSVEFIKRDSVGFTEIGPDEILDQD